LSVRWGACIHGLKSFLKKLVTRNRLRLFPAALATAPTNDDEWCDEAIAAHGVENVAAIPATVKVAERHATSPDVFSDTEPLRTGVSESAVYSYSHRSVFSNACPQFMWEEEEDWNGRQPRDQAPHPFECGVDCLTYVGKIENLRGLRHRRCDSAAILRRYIPQRFSAAR